MKVSICCLAYNHKYFIREALDSFLEQEVNFEYEILIHDDASTDGTAAIIEDYKKKFGNKIKFIKQDKNQYSIDSSLPITNLLSIAKGEYIAFCEGDDKWISTHKLSKQVAELDNNSAINLAFNPSYLAGKKRIIEGFYGAHKKIIKPSKIILSGGGGISSPSIMFRAILIPEIIQLRKESDVGDLVIQIVSAIPNGGLYLPEILSLRNFNHSGSWTNKFTENFQNSLDFRLRQNYFLSILSKKYPEFTLLFLFLIIKRNLKIILKLFMSLNIGLLWNFIKNLRSSFIKRYENKI